MWLFLGLGAWLASILALLGVLGMSKRESRREEADVRERHLAIVRRRRGPISRN